MIVFALRTNSAVQAWWGIALRIARGAKDSRNQPVTLLSSQQPLKTVGKKFTPRFANLGIAHTLRCRSTRAAATLMGSFPRQASKRAFFSLALEWPNVEPMSLT